MDDSAATFGLAKKDMVRTMDYSVISDLEPNKMAFVLSAVSPCLIANDVFEMGGELATCLYNKVTTDLCFLDVLGNYLSQPQESLLRDRASQARKNRAKTEQNEAVFQVLRAGRSSLWAVGSSVYGLLQSG